MKRTQINGKISHVHRLEELMLLKCPSTQSNTHTDCIRSLSKFQWYFHSNRKSNTVDDMPVEPSKTKYPKQLRSNRSTALPHFRLCYQATATQPAWHWLDDGHVGQRSRTRSPNKPEHTVTRFLTKTSRTHSGKDILLNSRKNRTCTRRRMKLDPYLTRLTKISPK